MKPPIFVYVPDDLDVFESVEAAELYIEPIDVKNDEFVYFDSEGRILKASVALDFRGIEKTVIRENENEEIDALGLRNILIDFLEELDFTRSELEKLDLSMLVQECLKFKTE